MKENSISIRLPLGYKEFLDKLAVNRIKIGTETTSKLSTVYLTEILIKFFKLNNECYIKLVNMEKQND